MVLAPLNIAVGGVSEHLGIHSYLGHLVFQVTEEFLGHLRRNALEEFVEGQRCSEQGPYQM
jgi:hypothetical protein